MTRVHAGPVVGRIMGLVAGIVLLAGILPADARAERVLRTDEVPVGELDPHKARDVADSYLMYNVYDTLVFPGLGEDHGRIVPHLAESYAIDGQTYTFKLRDGVKFHGGGTLDAEDVIFSLERMVDLGQGFSYLFSGWIESMEAPDPRTVVIRLSKPYAPFLAALTRLSIVDMDTVLANKQDGDFGERGDYGQAFLHENDAGTGAYRVASHVAQNETVLEKFDDYFLGVPEVAPDEVRIRYGLEGATALTMMQRGELDIASQWQGPEIKKSMAALDGVEVEGESGIAQYWIKLHTQKPPLDDVHCRRALSYALDYAALRSQAQIASDIAGAEPTNGPLLPTMLGYDASMPMFEQNMEKAKAELAQCQYNPAAHTIEISWIAEVAIEERYALLMQHNWQQLGFKAEVVRVPWALYTERTARKETTPHVGQLFYNARTPDPDAYLYSVYHSGAHGQYAAAEWLDDEKVDALLEQGRTETDPGKRAAIYGELIRRIVELRPSIYGYQIVNLYPKREDIAVPTLGDPKMNTGLMGGNMLFRLMEVPEES